MQFSIDRAALIQSLGHVQSVVERRNTIPILSNVMMSVSDGRLVMTATDLDIEIQESAEAAIQSDGDITAPAHTLYEIVRKLPDGAEVGLSTGSNGRLNVDAGRSHFSLPLLPPGDFPKMTADDFSHDFTVSASDLARLIDKTRFAISTEETRYYLNGIYMHAAGDKLRFVATDGHRLALAESALPSSAAGLPGVIIPRKTVQELRRLLDGSDAEVAVSVSEAKIRFGMGTAVLTSKLIDGSFPDYDRVIPKNNPHTLVLDNRVFAQAVDRVATISAEKSRSIKLSLTQDKLTLIVNNPESGEAHEELAVDYGAEAMDIGFNAKYLLDVTGQIGGDEARFALADPSAPALVKDSGDDDALFVLMPLRV